MDANETSGSETTAESAVSSPASAQKVGRNDDCPCGSGKKFKKCCIHEPAYNPPVEASAGSTAKGTDKHTSGANFPAATNATFRGANAPPTMRGGTTSRRRV
jgi:hypothetical protein